jgi:hypothetical protein
MKSARGTVGEFIYFGIVPRLNVYMGHEKFKKKILEKHEINLSFNVDGVAPCCTSFQIWRYSYPHTE